MGFFFGTVTDETGTADGFQEEHFEFLSLSDRLQAQSALRAKPKDQTPPADSTGKTLSSDCSTASETKQIQNLAPPLPGETKLAYLLRRMRERPVDPRLTAPTHPSEQSATAAAKPAPPSSPAASTPPTPEAPKSKTVRTSKTPSATTTNTAPYAA